MTSLCTDACIRSHIEQAAAELEEDGQLRFPDSQARSEFIDDCVSGELEKADLYSRSPFSVPDYAGAVLDLARLYGYLV